MAASARRAAAVRVAVRMAALVLVTCGVAGQPAWQPAWQQLAPLRPEEAPRDGQSLVFAESDGAVLAFGGLCFGGFGPTCSQDKDGDLWKYSVANNSWSRLPPTTEDRPSARMAHGAAFSQRDRAFWMYGGQIPEGGWMHLNDLWKYSLASNSWQQFATPPGQGYPNVRGMAFSEADNALYILGEPADSETDDLFFWKYSLTSNSWQRLPASGEAPSGRDSLAMAYSELDRALFVCGSVELWKYSVDAHTWQVLRPGRARPRFDGPSAAFFQADRQFLLLGGRALWRYSVAANSWQELLPSGSPPEYPRGPVALAQSDRTLYFTAQDAMQNYSEFWKITGLQEGRGQSGTTNASTNYV